MKFPAFVITLGLSMAFHSAVAEQRVVRGSHLDQDYEFALNDEYSDVRGSWGVSSYDLEWDANSGTLEGTAAGESELIAIDSVRGNVELTAYCGWGNLEYSNVEPWRVWGDLCGEAVDRNFNSQNESQDWMKSALLERILVDFPEPAKPEVQTFLAGLLKF